MCSFRNIPKLNNVTLYGVTIFVIWKYKKLLKSCTSKFVILKKISEIKIVILRK